MIDITIPNSVVYLGEEVFEHCERLESVKIGNSVTSIPDRAFSKCYKLKSIIISNSVNSIGANAFYCCESLTSITIPNSVTSIGMGCFYYTPWYNAFPDGLVYINNFLYEYKGKMLENTSINIKDGIVSISGNAFSYYSGLSSIYIPKSVMSIGDETFAGCTGLKSINCLAKIPPELSAAVFRNVDKSIPLYVPEASIPLYKAAEHWKDFSIKTYSPKRKE